MSKYKHSQAERATVITLAAFNYHNNLAAGHLNQDVVNEQPLCMETYKWIFNIHRRPELVCNTPERFPGHDYIIAMRRGHVFKIPLKSNGKPISHSNLKAIFKTIINKDDALTTSWVSLLTTDRRELWAKVREELRSISPSNMEYLSVIEKALFVICLDDSSPETPQERIESFLFDDNSNRWNDKGLSFIVCANGVSSFWCEHAMIDGSTFMQLGEAITDATREHEEPQEIDESTTEGTISSGLRHYSVDLTPSIEGQIERVRQDYNRWRAKANFTFFEVTALTGLYLRSHKLPPKTVLQLVIQLAVRWHFGYSPASYESVSMRTFRKGRLESVQVHSPEVTALCKATEDATVPSSTLKDLFEAAVKTHVAQVAHAARGRGWERHIMALRYVLQEGEEVPSFYHDPMYTRTRGRKVYSALGMPVSEDMPEGGSLWRDLDSLWIQFDVFDNKCKFRVGSMDGTAVDFQHRIESAAQVIRNIIERN